MGLPVLRAFSLCTCCRHYPGTVTEGAISLIPPALSAFPEMAVGSACATPFSRLAQRSLTLPPAHSLDPPKVTRYIKGFSYFVTSIAAPIASGWSIIAGWDSHPLGKRRLITAHTHNGRLTTRQTRRHAAVTASYSTYNPSVM